MALPCDSSSRPAGSTRRLPCLDGLRALAVGLVILNHGRAQGTLPQFAWLPPLNGLGASLFFLISGFLITTRLLKEKERSGHISLARFYRRRARRLLPAFCLFLAGALLLRSVGWGDFSNAQLIACLTFCSNVIGGPPTWLLGHLWSLSLQEQFYLVWPVLLLLLRGRMAALAAIAGILAWPLLRLVRRGFLASGVGIVAVSKAGMDTLLCGALLALLVRDKGLHAPLRRVARHPACLYLPLLLLGSLYTFHAVWPRSLTVLLPLLRNTALACLLWWCVNNPGHALGRFLESRPMVLMGRMSYSLYLWQQPFLGPYAFWLCGFPQNLVAILTVAGLSYWCVERPFERHRESPGPGAPREWPPLGRGKGRRAKEEAMPV